MGEFKIEILNENTENNELELFLNSSQNCTIFHRPSFLAYHDKVKFSAVKEFSFRHFIFRNEKNKISAFIPGAEYLSEDNKKIFKTPSYSSYGGMVYDTKLKFDEFEKITDLFLNDLKVNNFTEVFFTQTADCYCGNQSELNNYLIYILKLKGFELTNIEMILVKNIDGDFTVNFHDTIQRQIKQAIKNNLVFKTEKDITPESYKLLEKSQVRLGGKPTHSFEELIRIHELFPDDILTFTTFYNDKIIAGIIGFVCNKDVLNTFYIYDDEDQRELKGMQFTYYNVLLWAKENNIKYVDLGPATFGLKPHYSLINYKEKYGSIPMLRNTYSVKYD